MGELCWVAKPLLQEHLLALVQYLVVAIGSTAQGSIMRGSVAAPLPVNIPFWEGKE